MRYAAIILGLACFVAPVLSQEKAEEGPTNEKAQKTYKEGLEYLRQRRIEAALGEFRKADKQDDGHCLPCQRKIIKYGTEVRDWKAAEAAAEEMAGQAQGPKNVALAHYQLGALLMHEGMEKHKEDLFTQAHEEMLKALAPGMKFPAAIYADGLVLAQLKQDDAAKARFEEFVKLQPENDPDRQRALRYISEPELTRARMAPPFAITTADGQRISLDDLTGKVVLLDFWATWCGPCREALPHIREIAKKFQGQPLVVLSISLDTDEQKWKQFVAKNEMTWLQYRDDGFTGPIAKGFGVQAIPHTFTIDADGVLQDEHIGDASIEGKLKKLVNRARELQTTAKQGQ
jgi:thiol-disulfide isomerase/thioredoxin